MPSLACSDLGFECDFETGKCYELDSALSKFARHMREKHGINYTREDLKHVPVSGKLF